jgi:hypothetical protein
VSRKDGAQALARLQREGIIVTVDRLKTGHLRVVLANGAVYHAAGTPSDHRAAKNMECSIRRLTRVKASGDNRVSRLNREGLK